METKNKPCSKNLKSRMDISMGLIPAEQKTFLSKIEAHFEFTCCIHMKLIYVGLDQLFIVQLDVNQQNQPHH